MPAFCGNCGFSLGANAAFCPQCGARQTGAAGPSVPPPAMNVPPAMPVKSTSGLKILVVVLVCLAVIGVGAVGTVIYVGYRVKRAVMERAATYGVDLPSTTSSGSRISRSRFLKACDLISKEDVAQLLGQPIERVEGQSGTCAYYGPAGLSAKLAQADADSTIKRAEAPGSTAGGGEDADSVAKLLGSMAAVNGQTVSGGEAPLLTIVFSPTDGRAQMTALSIIRAGVSRDPALKGGIATIPSLGDRAIRFGNVGLSVLQGDAMVRIVVGQVPDANDKDVAIARAILPKL